MLSQKSYRLRVLLFFVLPILFFAYSDNDSPAFAVRGTYKGTLNISDSEKLDDVIMTVKATDEDIIYCEYETVVKYASSPGRIKVEWEDGKLVNVFENHVDDYRRFSYDPSTKTIEITVVSTVGIYHYIGTKTK